jgi:hypothetical protein
VPLTPNSPASRFEYVIKTYWPNADAHGAVLDTFYVTTSLVGAHDLSGTAAFPVIRHEWGSPFVRHMAEEIFVERIQKRLDVDERPRNSMEGLKVAKAAKAMLARLGQLYEYDAKGVISWDGEQWSLAELVLQVVRLPEHNRHDFLIPWIGRELVKLAKEVFKGKRRPASAGRLGLTERLQYGVTASDYWDAVHALYDKAPAIAQWAKETRTDIGKVDLATALETIKTYEFKTSLVEQGTIVYAFADGWTVQELRTESALSAEGTNMQNCIASYHEEVGEGRTRIYSIRDKSGNPHVSMELRGVAPVTGVRIRGTPMSLTIGPPGAELSPKDFIRSPARMSWYFAQILGKQNDRPIDAYRERAREFVDKVFDKEGFGWVITGGTPKWARFAGRQLNDIDFGEISGVNHLDGDEFVGADFTDANLTGCKMVNANFDSAIFNKARLSEANLTDASATDAKFEGALCYFTDFRRANLRGASFDSAHCGGAVFDHALLVGASFRHARVDGATFSETFTRWSDTEESAWEGVWLSPAQRAQMGVKRA